MTTYIATVSKAAAIAVLIRLVAIKKDLKRLLAYSAVAHAGYVLMGILSTSENG